ncbi:MAG: adenylate/guanylate cyclase domain-containing protein [Verrucomicrobia bacterium]|nr:adenylate/guanylate cyclase domain-containing protein [Verrucomicrobiota bacterium]
MGTLLLSDLVGFEMASESVYAEDLVEVVNRLAPFQTEIIHKHSGMILTCVGDALRAVWPAERIEPSHAELAFRAAREILEGYKEVRSPCTSISFRFRLALGTGEMAGALLGSQTVFHFDVLGPATAIADKLMSCEPSGNASLLLTEETIRLLSTPREHLRPLGTIMSAQRELQVFEYSV